MSEFEDTMRQERVNRANNAQQELLRTLVAKIDALTAKIDELSVSKKSTYKPKAKVDES